MKGSMTQYKFATFATCLVGRVDSGGEEDELLSLDVPELEDLEDSKSRVTHVNGNKAVLLIQVSSAFRK